MRLLPILAALTLAGCSSIPARQRASAVQDIPDNGPHPPGVVAAVPPADNSFTPLRCRPNGQETVCTRGSD